MTYQGRRRRQQQWRKRRGERSDGRKRERLLDWDNGREKYNVEQLTNKGNSIVSIWPMYRVCNTNALLYECHKDMEDG